MSSLSQDSALEAFMYRIGEQRRCSKYTLRNYRESIEEWFAWLNSEGFGTYLTADKRIARNYVAFLSLKCAHSTIRNKVSALRSFYKFLMQCGDIETDPFATLRLPKLSRELPVFLSQAKTPLLLEAPWRMLSDGEIDARKAHRDAICLELLYGAGLRVGELCSLKWEDVDLPGKIARVLGKGGKTRFCPIGGVAAKLLLKWRDEYANPTSRSDYILHSDRGKPLYPRYVQKELKLYLIRSGLPINITPHKLRHTFATHLVNRGVDLRSLQEMMGHASLSTTQIYTHLNTRQLVAEHRAAHPRAHKL